MRRNVKNFHIRHNKKAQHVGSLPTFNERLTRQRSIHVHNPVRVSRSLMFLTFVGHFIHSPRQTVHNCPWHHPVLLPSTPLSGLDASPDCVCPASFVAVPTLRNSSSGRILRTHNKQGTEAFEHHPALTQQTLHFSPNKAHKNVYHWPRLQQRQCIVFFFCVFETHFPHLGLCAAMNALLSVVMNHMILL